MKLSFNIHGIPFEIDSRHALFSQLVQEELRAFRSAPQKKPKNALRLRVRTGSRFGKDFMVTPGAANGKSADIFIADAPSLFPDPAYYFGVSETFAPALKKNGFFFIHAACLAKEGKGILLAGGPKAGKSTLSVCALREGFKFLGDEQPLLVLKGGKILAHAFPRRIRLDRSNARRFPELKSILQKSTAPRIPFHADDVWPGCLERACTVRAIIFPRFRRGARLRLDRIASSAAFSTLLKDEYFVWYRDGRRKKLSWNHFRLLEQLALRLPAFALEYGAADIFEIPRLLRRLCRSLA